MAVKKVKVEDAVGMALGHDITKIVPGEYKGPLFRKGHIIRAEDIEALKNIGKEHIYLIELLAGQLHENDAVKRMAAAIAGENVYYKEPSEGKINIYASYDGLLKINTAAVNSINMIENSVLSTLHGNQIVYKDQLLAGVKVVLLVVDAAGVTEVEEIAGRFQPVVSVTKFGKLRVGIVITGSEVASGRTKDRFAAMFAEKAKNYGFDIAEVKYCSDDPKLITEAILYYKQAGLEMIITSGGMSVDPDDVTPDAIRATGAEIAAYGTPVLPGAMFMLAYLGETPIMGLPACGMYAKITVFDLILPRILAGERLKKADIAEMGYGGLCMNCSECRFPYCSFGK